METTDLKSKSPAGKQGLIELQDKGSTFSFKSKILSILKSGKCFTAIELNELTHSNDSRKRISELRALGYLINDYRLQSGQKNYFLKPNGQLELFPEI